VQCIIPQWYIAMWCLGDLVLKSAQPRWVFYSLRNYFFFFYILWICKIYMLFYKSKPTVCWIYLFWMIWVLSSMLNLSMIFWRIVYCMWSVEWIVWLCAVVGNFEYYNWCLRNWCCNMFVDFGSVIINCFVSILHWCMVTQSW
jgi:hypothetical protein